MKVNSYGKTNLREQLEISKTKNPFVTYLDRMPVQGVHMALKNNIISLSVTTFLSQRKSKNKVRCKHIMKTLKGRLRRLNNGSKTGR